MFLISAQRDPAHTGFVPIVLKRGTTSVGTSEYTPGTSYLVPGIDVFIAAVPAIPPIRDDGNHIRVLVYSEQKIKDIPGTWYLVGTLGTTHFSDLRLTQPIIYVYSYS